MINKKGKTAEKILGTTAIAAAALGIFLFSESRSDKFLYRTQISGLDITGYTLEEAQALLLSSYTEDTIRLVEDGQVDLEGSLSEFGYTLDKEQLHDTLLTLFVQEKTDLPTLLSCEFGLSIASAEIPFSVDETVFDAKVRVENLAVPRRDALDATVVYDEDAGRCIIAPEAYGNRISDEALSSYMKEQLDTLVAGHRENIAQVSEAASEDPSGALRNDGAVEIPFPEDKLTAPETMQDDPTLIATCDALNVYAGSEILYDFGEEKLDVNFGQIMEMLNVEVNETTVSVSLNEEAVEDFVSNLASTYNTRYVEREFETSVGSTVTIPAKYCDYGYTIDQEEEISKLKEELLGGAVVEREPVYYLKNSYGNPYFYKRNGKDDLAGTYVEVNLTRQHMWYYLDGELFLESDFVSGDISKGHGTQFGVFPLAYKESPSILSGGQGDGEYETKVNYWMPFYEGQGLHDATWRSRFGGSIYRSNGSHGCVNLPLSVAENLYNHIEPGVAIVIYYE